MWASYERFASSTELHGFNMILMYKDKKFWAAVWICLTAGAVCMCANDTVNLVILYMSEPTAVSVSMKENLSVTLPNPTLCMDVHIDEPMLHEIVQSDMELKPLHYTPLTTSQIQTKIEIDIGRFLQATDNADNLDLETYDRLNLSPYLEYYTYMMLSYIAEGELKLLGYNNPILKLYETDYVKQRLTKPINVNATIGYLYYSYMNKNVDVANLQRLVGMSICQKRTDRFTSQKNKVSESHPICKPLMITHLSFSRVCSKLFEHDSQQLTQYDRFTLHGTKPTEFLAYDTDLSINIFTFTTSRPVFTWYLDFLGRDILPPDDRNGVYGWNPTVSDAVEVYVAAEYQFYDAHHRPCSDDETTYVCDRRQRVEKLQNTCGCRPSSLADGGFGDKSLPMCGQDYPLWIIVNDTVTTSTVADSTYMGFCSNDIPNFSDIVCTRNCLIGTLETVSTAPTYVLNMGLCKVGTRLPDGLVEFSFRTVGSHPYFEELPTKTFDSFICDLGGSIGAWLGASLMAFIHAAIHLFLTCRNVANRLGQKQEIPAK